MNSEQLGDRREQRLEEIADLRRKLHRSAMAMSFLPPEKLAQHLDLPDVNMAEKLLQNQRLTQRIYWQLVDDDLVPDIAATPERSALAIIDSKADFDHACESVDIVRALHEQGVMIPKDAVKELARQYGEDRLKWAWDNRDIWATKIELKTSGAIEGAKETSDASGDDLEQEDEPAIKADTRHMVLDHLAQIVPDLALWMGKTSDDAHSATPEMAMVGRVMERLMGKAISQAGGAHHVG